MAVRRPTQFILRCYEEDLAAVRTSKEALRAMSEHIRTCPLRPRLWLTPEMIDWVQFPERRTSRRDTVHTWWAARLLTATADDSWLGHSIRWPPMAPAMYDYDAEVDALFSDPIPASGL